MRTILNLAGYLALIAAPASGMVTPDSEDRAFSILPRPYAEVWTARELFHRGEHARVYFRSEFDSHILVLRIDTDGAVDVLFPANPWSDTFVRGSRRYEIRTSSREAFRVDDSPGQGFVVIVAARDPFLLGELADSRGWAPERILLGGRLAGDPYVGIHSLVGRLVQSRAQSHVDVTPYYVEHRYEYPRFLCYDCHSYASYSAWDPYTYSCIRFRIVIQDDPYYYPARYHSGTRVVYRRPDRIEPRYVIRNREAGRPYIGRESNRRASETISERVRGYTSQDFGGRGSVATPDVISARQRITGPRRPTADPGDRAVDTVFVDRKPDTEPRLRTNPWAPGERSRNPSDRQIFIAPPATRNGTPRQEGPEVEPSSEQNRRRVVAPARAPGRVTVRVPTRSQPSRVAPRQPSSERGAKVDRRRPEGRTVRGRRPPSDP